MGKRAPLVTREGERIYIDWMEGDREVTISFPVNAEARPARRLAREILQELEHEPTGA